MDIFVWSRHDEVIGRLAVSLGRVTQFSEADQKEGTKQRSLPGQEELHEESKTGTRGQTRRDKQQERLRESRPGPDLYAARLSGFNRH